MVTRRQKPSPKRAPARRAPAAKKPAPKSAKPASKSVARVAKVAPKPAPKPSSKTSAKSPVKPPAKSSVPKAPEVTLEVPLPGGRRHVLSLSFVRDGDEFLARLETDSGHITELKNRSLDQLLTLVASELEDLLE